MTIVANKYIFLGCRDHKVYPVDLQTLQIHKHLNPPHFDAITSLQSFLNNKFLVSGSRDKNLRLYKLPTST